MEKISKPFRKKEKSLKEYNFLQKFWSSQSSVFLLKMDFMSRTAGQNSDHSRFIICNLIQIQLLVPHQGRIILLGLYAWESVESQEHKHFCFYNLSLQRLIEIDMFEWIILLVIGFFLCLL